MVSVWYKCVCACGMKGVRRGVKGQSSSDVFSAEFKIHHQKRNGLYEGERPEKGRRIRPERLGDVGSK